MSFNFPASPTEGQVFTPPGGPSYVWRSPAWQLSVPPPLAVVPPRYNRIINGDFHIWQREASQTSNGYGSDDRWVNGSSASTTKTHSRQPFTLGQNFVPGNPTYYSRTAVTAAAGAADFAAKDQRIEGVQTLSGRTATLTFWARVVEAGKSIAVDLAQIFGTGGSPSAAVSGIGAQKFALAAANTWQKFSLAVAIPSIAGKVLGSNGDHYLQVVFWFDAGSNFNGRTASLGHQSGTFDIAHVSLVEGDVTTEDDPFAPRHIQQEVALCQRYYEKSSNLDVIPENGMARHTQYVAVAYQANGAKVTTIPYIVEKRKVPTVTIFNTADGAAGAGKVAVYNGTWNVATSQLIEAGSSNTKGITLLVNYTPMTAAASYLTSFGWAADAEL